MKAIPTIYDGQEYRSRLEARWGVFFDKMNFPAYYEPFTIENNGFEYKPDFICFGVFTARLPVIFEIKPKQPNSEYLKYLSKIHDPSKSDILICVGNPNLIQPDGFWIRGIRGKVLETRIFNGFGCIRCSECGRFTINTFAAIEHNFSHLECGLNHNKETGFNDEASEYAENYRFDL